MSKPDGDTGRLLLAATPLGDASDASPRLRRALAEADVIAAEDTRRTRNLAATLDVVITGRVVSFYDHVEAARIPALLAQIAAGRTVLLVTDAGMPLVSDPGYRLVVACVEHDLPLTCLPGPSAVTTALAVSGLPMQRFCFDGFAPRKSSQRRAWLSELIEQPRACVFFESPHRLAECLADAVDVLGGDRHAAICRELTKIHEEVVRGTLAELVAWARGSGVRGEITVVVAGAEARVAEPSELVDDVEALVATGVGLKDACTRVARDGVSRRRLYDAVLSARRGVDGGA